MMPYPKHNHKWKFITRCAQKSFYWCKSCGSLKIVDLFGKVRYRLSNSYKASLPKVADRVPPQEETETGAKD